MNKFDRFLLVVAGLLILYVGYALSTSAPPLPLMPEFGPLLPVAAANKEVPGPFDHVKVGPYNYKVIWMSSFMDDCLSGQLDDGCTEAEKDEIRVTMVESKQELRTIVLHEVMHAILHSGVEPSSNETVAQTSGLLLQVLQDNPQLVKFLLDK